MKVLVTGHRGYLGGATAVELRDAGHDVIGLDNGDAGRVASIPGIEEHEGAVRDVVGDVEMAMDTDVVVHLAAMPGIGRCEAYPTMATETNVIGTAKLAYAWGPLGVPLVFASSVGVYGSQGYIDGSQHRRAPNFYMQTKRAGEDVISAIANEYMPAVTFQMGNLYGTYSVGGETVNKSTVVNYFIEQAREGETITIHTPGDQTRDFVHVEDAAAAYRLAAEKVHDWPDGMETLLLATGETHTVTEVANWAASAAPDDVETALIENPRTPRYVGEIDTTMTEAALGWVPTTDVEVHVREAVRE